MGEGPGTWWHERNDQLRDSPWADESSLLPEHVCDLLDEVEGAFATSGGQTTSWPGRPVDQPPAEEEYSRCLDPDKFRIVQARIDAWVAVLVARNWAQVATARSTEWRGDHEHWQTTVAIRPSAEAQAGGAVPLTFVVDDSTDPELTLNVEVCAGEPPYELAELPGCGCDACDSGSAWLLEEVDQWTLSVVDGSLVVDPSARLQVRNFFGGHGSGGGSVDDSGASAAFTAAPWAPGWEPLTVPDREDLSFPAVSNRGPRYSVRDSLRDLIRRLWGKPKPDRGWTIYRPVDRD